MTFLFYANKSQATVLCLCLLSLRLHSAQLTLGPSAAKYSCSLRRHWPRHSLSSCGRSLRSSSLVAAAAGGASRPDYARRPLGVPCSHRPSTDTIIRMDTATRTETHLSIFSGCAARHSLTLPALLGRKKGLHRTILDT